VQRAKELRKVGKVNKNRVEARRECVYASECESEAKKKEWIAAT